MANIKRIAGVTLIELMIVVAIVAILSTISVASYRRYALRANRTEAKAALLQVQMAQEKFFLKNNFYATTAMELTTPTDVIPNGLGQNSSSPNYNYALGVGVTGTNASYSATATPIAGQIADIDCANFSITDQGQRTATTSNGTVNTAECWK